MSGLISDQALAMRSRAAAGDPRRAAVRPGAGAPQQIVVKVVGTTKSAAGVMRMVRYVAREGERFVQPVTLRDELGGWPGGAREALAEWELLDDEDNLSIRAKALAKAEKLEELAALDQRERLYRIQAWHIAVSVKAAEGEDRDGMLADLEEGARCAVLELFGDDGRRAVWAVHDDGKEPHVHIVVDGMATQRGRALRLDPHGDVLDSWRETFARQCRDCGLNVTAERRVDRAELRERILAGDEPLKASWSMHRARSGRHDLAVKVPVWFVRDGLAYEKRETALARLRAKAQERASAVKGRKAAAQVFEQALSDLLPPPSRRTPKARREGDEAALYDLVSSAFVDPEAALESWRRMATEGVHRGERGRIHHPSRSLAAWWLINRPQAFGEITAAALSLKDNERLKALLRQMRPLPRKDERAIRKPDIEAMARQRQERAEMAAAARLVATRARVGGELQRLAASVESRFGPSGRVERIREAAASVYRTMPAPVPSRPGRLLDRILPWRRGRDGPRG